MKKQIGIFLASLILLASCNNAESSIGVINGSEKKTPLMKDGVITLKSGVKVEKKDGNFYLNGDIILSKEQLKALDEHGDFVLEKPKSVEENEETLHPVYNLPLEKTKDGKVIPRALGVYPTPYNMWAMVRFVYAPNLTPDRKRIIRSAMRHWESRTNVRFYNATGKPTSHPTYGFKYPYVEFVNSNANRSFVGRIGGRQSVELASRQPVSTAIHEIGHAIGLLHEQSRPDRDRFINVNWNNIKSGARHNFSKRTRNYYSVGALDYNSIMIYDSFISDPSMVVNASVPILTRKDGTTWNSGNVLSDGDRRWANSIYLPFVARSDAYRELAPVVYKRDNTIMTARERRWLQAKLNNGNPNPPSCCRLPNNF